MAEDLGEEDIVGDVFGFELVAADGAVGAAEVTWFPGQVEGAESGGHVLGELWAGGGVNGCGRREAFEVPESVEGLDDFLGVAENGDEVGLETGTGSLAGFELAVEEEGGIGELFPREAEGGTKKDLGRPAPGEGHEAHAFLEVAVAGEEFESFLDEGLRIERDEIGLVAVNALVVSGVERAGFFWFERQIAEALAGAHFPWAQDQVVWLHGADRVAILGEGELDGGQGVTGFEPADFGLADSVKFLEGEGARAHLKSTAYRSRPT
ncbi:MAG TPA: hypothetical protein VK775_14470, partial [Chthoniobacterales bacterium]|nr:hypothetical protein [Chthoniobacterales bacterium]